MIGYDDYGKDLARRPKGNIVFDDMEFRNYVVVKLLPRFRWGRRSKRNA